MNRILNSLSSFLWSSASKIKRLAYEKGFFKPVRLGARVISVGNIQAGGAGKTPLVAQIANEAAKRGLKVCILIRGYKGRWEKRGGVILPGQTQVNPEDCGDEAALLRELCPSAWIGVGKNRIKQFHALIKKTGIRMDLVILDDGFQNRKILKDLEIVALTSFKPSQMPFRDFYSSLVNADLLVWTKGEKTPQPISHSGEKPWVRIQYQLPDPETEESLWLLTGIADGEEAFRLALKTGYRVVKHTPLQDHFQYDSTLIQKVKHQADTLGLRIALTGKDWMKWKAAGISAQDVVVLEPFLKFTEGRDVWEKLLWEV